MCGLYMSNRSNWIRIFSLHGSFWNIHLITTLLNIDYTNKYCFPTFCVHHTFSLRFCFLSDGRNIFQEISFFIIINHTGSWSLRLCIITVNNSIINWIKFTNNFIIWNSIENMYLSRFCEHMTCWWAGHDHREVTYSYLDWPALLQEIQRSWCMNRVHSYHNMPVQTSSHLNYSLLIYRPEKLSLQQTYSKQSN